jgi:hypothetical protein
MSAELIAALAPFLDRLQRSVQSDAKLRAEVAALGKSLIAWCEPVPEPKPAPVHVPTPIIPLPPLVPAAAMPPAPSYGRRMDEPVAPASSPPVVPPPVPVSSPVLHGEDGGGWMPQEPSIIAGRCRAKGEACKLVAKKSAGTLDETQFAVGMAEARAAADKWPKCSLWMLDMVSLSRAAPVWDDLAGGYLTAADAADLLQVATDPTAKAEPDQMLAALNLAAEAQSLLFSAVIDTGNSRPDADQIQLYVTVRELAAARGTYIHRYLRRDDRVDPRSWPDLRKRIGAQLEPFVAFQRKAGNTKKVLANLKFKLKKAASDGPDRYDEWPRVMELLDEAVGGGIAPGHPELRDALLPVVESLPEDVMVPVNVAAIIRELDRHLASAPSNGKPPAPPTIAPEPLRGRSLVLVGGQLRPGDRDEIVRALDLAGLTWIEPDRDLLDIERAIADPDTAAVLYSVRWAGHAFPDIRRLCAAYAKRLVRLPGGYAPHAVANQWYGQSDSSLLVV